MGQSIISKPPRARRAVASGSGSTAINGGIIKIELPRQYLTSEHMLDFAISQTFGTNAPTSSDVRRMFTKFELISSIAGTIISCDFAQLIDSAKFAEAAAAPVVVLGAGGGAAATARFTVDMHHANDAATLDLLTALQTKEHGSLYMELTVAPDAANMFIGGTGTIGVAAVTVLVDASEYPAFSGSGVKVGSFAYGRAFRIRKRQEEKTGVTAASNREVKLETGGKLRYLTIHTYNTAGALPVLANGILDKVSLNINGVDYFLNTAAEALQQENIHDRGFAQTGVYVLDFGDSESGWPDLEGLSDVKLQYSTKGTAPATWKATVLQDMTKGLPLALA